jgi:hypothetical protein
MKNPFPAPGFTLHNLAYSILFKIPSPIVTHYWRRHDITTAPGTSVATIFLLHYDWRRAGVDDSSFLFRAFMGFSFTWACCLS